MRKPGTCGAFRIVERALLMSPRVRTLTMKSAAAHARDRDFHFRRARVPVSRVTAAPEAQEHDDPHDGLHPAGMRLAQSRFRF